MEPTPRLVLLYLPCTVNVEFLAPYEDVTFTPRLEEFAAQSVVFERHMTESGQSGPSYASIFTGRHADGHGVFHHPTPIDSEIAIVGEVFRRAGFYVEAWLAHVMASGELGYGRGANEVHHLALTHGTPEFVHLLRRLRDEPRAKALVVANHTLTHSPYRVESLGPFCARHSEECSLRAEDPQRFDAAAGFYLNHHAELSHDFPDVVARYELSKEQIDYLAQVIEVLYRANIARLDHHFGSLLDAIEAHGLTSVSLVAFTADHGEAMYREELLFPWTHGHQLAHEVLQVPLLIRAPGVAPRRYRVVTRSTDLLPTLASLAGVKPPVLPSDPWNGVDLAAAMRNEAPEPALEAYSHTALTARVVVEESASWGRFRSWFPREDPELMWAQLRSARPVADASFDNSVVQLRGHLDEAGSVSIVPAFVGSPPLDRDAALERVREYRRRLIEVWRDGSDAEQLDEEYQKELLRRLGYIE
ncbi:MAG: sulfatase-like hydrolase/transferase [Thermoanaerobaculia bacterium]|nr:sulfatase-like hydrolase/transferase [Thermoanaerobaculia bacterium]